MLKFRKKELILTLAVVAALVAAIITAIVYLSNKDSLVIKDPVFFSQMGVENSFSGKTRLSYEDKEMYLSSVGGSGRIALMNVPVYLEHKDQLILTQVMSYTNPDTNLIRKINYFATVNKQGDICTLSVDGKKNYDVKGGYLFDGKNTYIFLEPMGVRVGEDTIQLDALSYITVVNRNYLFYYSAGDDSSGYSAFDIQNIVASNMRNSYKLDLCYDLLLPSNGMTQMLIPNPEILDLIP